jgi:phosphate/sulfate permease
MDLIYPIILLVLLVLAVLDLTVGVANDAVNFLNSSVGSKVAPLWVILTVASIGVILGTLFSSGMMEIARSGVFHPNMFSFPKIMMLFLAVMITDVILLDIFNTLGLPTSTTVSLVFELLGAAVAVSLYIIWKNNAGNLAEYINSGKALAIISGILISVVVAFVAGSIIMYFTRLIFSFNYRKPFKYFGALWGGFALTAITYFIVFKGLKGSAIVSEDFLHYVTNNMGKALFYAFVGWTLLMALLQHLFKVDILKVIVLMGTMALALAFASNDLVNFIGVFMAGLSSYQIASQVALAGGNIETLYMDKLKEPVVADWRYLLGAGIIMVLALWFSKKARTVTETEVNLARQYDGGPEKFSSSPLSRSIVRAAVDTNRVLRNYTPIKIRKAINNRMMPSKEETNSASFDLIRASVNLTIAALLISLGTSLKLPLSTTYVSFMVAMGTSLADRAWGRESAVYRINGVLTVITGWFFTALVAFTIAFIIGLLLMWGGKIAIFALLAFIVFIFIKSSEAHRKRKEKEKINSSLLEDEKGVIKACTSEVRKTVKKMLSIYQQNIYGLTNEDRRLLRKISREADDLYMRYKNKRTYEVVPTIKAIGVNELDIEQEYVQVVDYTYEIAKALKTITSESYRYIDNNHKGFSDDQEKELHEISKIVIEMYEKFIDMMNRHDYSSFHMLINYRENILEQCAKLTKKQIKRVKANESGTRSSILFLNILNETKTIVLQSMNLMKSQKNMILTSKKTANVLQNV